MSYTYTFPLQLFKGCVFELNVCRGPLMMTANLNNPKAYEAWKHDKEPPIVYFDVMQLCIFSANQSIF